MAQPRSQSPVYAIKSPHQGSVAAVHRVERDGPLRRSPEGLELLAEEQHLCQRDDARGHSKARHRPHAAPPRVARPRGSGLRLNPLRVLFGVHDREHGPAVGITRRQLDAPLQSPPASWHALQSATLVVSEAAQHRLVRARSGRALVPERFAHAVRQNAVPVGDRGNDPRDERRPAGQIPLPG